MGFGMVMAPPDTYPIQRAMSELPLGQGPPNPPTPPAPDEWIRRLGTLPLMHQPGEKWMYNTGSDVLGVLIARASGKPLETFLRERIFEPLGMKDTGFSVPAAKLDRLATSYWTNFPTGALEVYDEAEGGQWSRPPAFPSGAGGLVSTIDDYLAFGQMMLNKGKHGKPARPLAAFGRAHDNRPADARSRRRSPASSPATSTATAGDSACPSSPGATSCGGSPGRSAGTAAWAPPGIRTPGRRWSPS